MQLFMDGFGAIVYSQFDYYRISNAILYANHTNGRIKALSYVVI